MHAPPALIWLMGVAQAVAPSPVPPSTSPEFRAALRTIEAAEVRRLADLSPGLDPATKARLIPGPPAPDGSTRRVLLPEVAARSTPTDRPDVRTIREETGRSLFELATKALAANPPALSLADEALRGVVDRIPDHPEARRLLGFLPFEGGWATPFAAKKRADGFVDHPRYGWVDSGWVDHLARGELPAPMVPGRSTQWVPADRADEFRRDFARGWQISTEHFTIKTNVPLAEVIAFGRHLEAMHDVFSSIMADLIGTEHPLSVLSRNPNATPALAKKVHRVHYFATKEEYVSALLPVQGEGVRESLGTYLPAREAKRLGFPGGASFFFRDEGGQLDVTETLYHEVSHQLLFETAPGSQYDEKRANFWVFEGLGTYFETLRTEPDGAIRVGGMVGRRIEVARDRLVVQKEFLPIGRLATYNKFLFNGGNGNDIYLNYAESMALTVYFLQAGGGKYRDAFLDYAKDVYRGKVKPGAGRSLEDRLGAPLGEVDRDFLAYLRTTKGAEAGRR